MTAETPREPLPSTVSEYTVKYPGATSVRIMCDFALDSTYRAPVEHFCAVIRYILYAEEFVPCFEELTVVRRAAPHRFPPSGRGLAERANFGRLDILVNCAGVMLNENLEDADRANLRQTVEVNLLGLMNATREVLPLMQEQGTGHIVNISSLMGRKAIPGSSAYNATKSGVNSFTESLRQEVAEPGNRIRTTVIEPGLVDTGSADDIPDESQRIQVNELLTTISALSGEDVARVVLHAVTQPPHVDVNEVLLRPPNKTCRWMLHRF